MDDVEPEDSEAARRRRHAFTLRVLQRLRGGSALTFKQERAKVIQIVPTPAVREQMIARGVLTPAPSGKRPYTPSDARADRERWAKNAARVAGL